MGVGHVASQAVSLKLFVVREDREAILARQSDIAPVWLPRSQIQIGDDQVGRVVTVVLPGWLAKSKGLLVEADARQGELL